MREEKRWIDKGTEKREEKDRRKITVLMLQPHTERATHCFRVSFCSLPPYNGNQSIVNTNSATSKGLEPTDGLVSFITHLYCTATVKSHEMPWCLRPPLLNKTWWHFQYVIVLRNQCLLVIVRFFEMTSALKLGSGLRHILPQQHQLGILGIYL